MKSIRLLARIFAAVTHLNYEAGIFSEDKEEITAMVNRTVVSSGDIAFHLAICYFYRVIGLRSIS